MPKKCTIPPRVMTPTKETIKSCLCKEAHLGVLRHTFAHLTDRHNGGGKIPLTEIEHK
jgi:hypothetical protein